MIARDSVGHEGQAGAIEFSPPTCAAGTESELEGFIDFSVGIRFVPTLVPAPAPEQAEPIVERLLEVYPEAVLDGVLERVRSDFGNGRDAGKKVVDRLTIATHVRVIYVSEQAQDAFLLEDDSATDLEFNILGARAAEVRVEMNTVCAFRHQCFRKTRGPVTVVILEHRGEGKAASVRGVVVGAVVVERPVHKLKIGVRAIIVVIEEVCETDFSKTNFEPAFGQSSKKRK